ncbi:MAG: hypothetical protein JSS82_06000 [Bacteroidetes bacterium]|nr:hypothetical protein [Bacteroidota bacterium]
MTQQANTSAIRPARTFKTIHLFGMLVLGIMIMCLIYIGRLAYINKFTSMPIATMGHAFSNHYDTIKNGKYMFVVNAKNDVEIKEQNEVFDEKIKSVNDRTGDLYLSLTIIITLLVVFNIGVFINASHDAKIKAEEYLTQHIGEYEQKAKDLHQRMQSRYTESMSMIQEMSTEYKSAMELKSKFSNIQNNGNNDDGNGANQNG